MGTLRIHFTADDLGRLRMATRPDVTWEVVLSLLKLQHRYPVAAFDGWRRRAIRANGPWLRALSPLVPLGGYFADFLTPPEGTQGLDAAVDAILHTPVRQLRHEVELLNEQRRLPSWSHDLAAGRPGRMRLIAQTLRRYHDAVLAPFWPCIDRSLSLDRSRRVHALTCGGGVGLLDTFAPMMRWSPPTLEVRYCVSRELHLDGRGLLLVPSFFCWDTPVSLLDPELQPVLVYPVERGPALGATGQRPPAQPGALNALLGHTRAAVLLALAWPCTTTELAERAGVGLASASQHATVLREAGLITTTREGRSVRHCRTVMGHQLANSPGY
jgi:DNA-binding transcriptional ArsR family regulator